MIIACIILSIACQEWAMKIFVQSNVFLIFNIDSYEVFERQLDCISISVSIGCILFNTYKNQQEKNFSLYHITIHTIGISNKILMSYLHDSLITFEH